MTSTVPSPVAAALGIVPTVFGGVRRLPGQVIALPVHVLGTALTTLDRTRREYDALADRGERLIARLRGVSFDELEDRFEDSLQGTPLAAPYDTLEDALEDAAENVTALARKAPGAVRSAPARARTAGSTAASTAGSTATDAAQQATSAAAATVAEVADDAASAVQSAADAVAPADDIAQPTAEKAVDTSAPGTPGSGTLETGTSDTCTSDTCTSDTGTSDTGTSDTDETPAAEAPKGVPTPRATEPDSTRVSTAASSDVVQAVERVSAVVGGEVLAHDELPLPDYDHMTLGSLRGRMRALDVAQLVQIRDYEKAHANRLPIVTMLDNRIAKLATDPTAPLSGGSPTAVDPTRARGNTGGSKVDPSTGGPAQNPPSQGVPTNPAQPR